VSERNVFFGSRPSSLRVEDRADGRVRLRIEGPGCDDALVDLDTAERVALIARLSQGEPG